MTGVTDMRTHLWGGPLDGMELDVPEPPKPEMVVGQLTDYPPNYAQDATDDVHMIIRHHYVFDSVVCRYNYAGDWPDKHR